jgi:hypothetical protein
VRDNVSKGVGVRSMEHLDRPRKRLPEKKPMALRLPLASDGIRPEKRISVVLIEI